MNSRALIATLLLSATLLGIDFERVKPKEPVDNQKQGNLYIPNGITSDVRDGNQVIIPNLNGIILTDAKSHPSKEETLRAIGGAESLNIQIPGSVKNLNAMLRRQFLNRPLTKQGMADLKREILLYYRRFGHPIITIEIPEQKITDGILQLVIIEGKLGKVTVEGNRYFKSSTLSSYIRVEEGEAINYNGLITDLNWINRNPFRTVDAIFAPGEIAGTTNIRLLTLDRRPYRFYGGVDNTGFEETDTTRLFVGANWGNAFFLDQILSVQFTFAPNIDKFWALTGHYTIPLPWRDIWVFYGGYSHVHAVLKNPKCDTSGYAAGASTRYNFILQNQGNYLHDVNLGFDYKRTDNNIEYGGEMVFKNSVNLTQFVLGYNSAYDSEYFKVSLTLEFFYSPGSWLPEQSNSNYTAARPDAKNHYLYTRLALSPIIRLPKDFSFSLTLRGQAATQNLLASEQYGLGGYNTVRGYKEREVNVDNAILASAELRSPSLTFLKRPRLKDSTQFLLFLDYALGRNVHILQNQPKTHYLLSFGPGLRYAVAPYLSFRGDLGIQLKKLDSPGSRFHFALVASY